MENIIYTITMNLDQLNLIGNISSVIYVSSITGAAFSGLDTPEGISQFFVKQNNLTDIDANDFERNILIPLDKYKYEIQAPIKRVLPTPVAML